MRFVQSSKVQVKKKKNRSAHKRSETVDERANDRTDILEMEKRG